MQDDNNTTLHEGGLPQQEKFINPYTDFGFKKLFEQSDTARYSEAERRQYEESRKEYWDYFSTMETAEKKGHKKGLAEGMEKGLAEGMEKGLAEGKRNVALSVARKMKADNMPIEIIAKFTGLTEEEIDSL